MGTPKCKFGEAQLDASGEIRWDMTRGVNPWVGFLEFDVGERGQLEFGDETTLTIEDGEGRKLEVKKLFAVGEMPAQDPFRSRIIVADQRLFWRRRWVKRSYNVRTRTGNRRRLDADGTIPEEIAVTVDDVFYKAYSLRSDGSAWDARQMLEDVLAAVVGESEVRIVGRFDRMRYVDNLEIDAPAPEALATALSYLPGAEVFVDEKGTVVIYNRYLVEAVQRLKLRLDGQEDLIPEARRNGQGAPNPYKYGSPIDAFQSLRDLRPDRIVCLFTVEQELRIDSKNPETDTSSTAFDRDGRWCENVLEVPDPTLEIPAASGRPARTVVQGTWITVEEALDAWNAVKGDADLPDLTHESIRELWMTSYLESLYGGLGKLEPRVVWLYRIGSLRRHYRQTYRINRRFVQRFASWRPYRVALLDFETGQFARSSVYQDFTVVFNERGLLAQASDMVQTMGIESSVDPGEKLSESEGPAPALLTVVDAEQGIVRVDFQADLLGHVHQIIPSLLEDVVTMTAEEWNQKTYFHDGTKGKDGQAAGITLKKEHRCSFVITFVPGSPNTNEQLHPIEVEYAEARDYLPDDLPDVVESKGPTWYMRVGPQVATARYAWNHEKRGLIEESVGAAGSTEGIDRSQLAEELQNPTELAQLAAAVAAGLYSSMMDRTLMARRMDFMPDLEIVGNLERVSHVVSTTGEITTEVIASDELPPADFMALLPPSARRIFQRMVQPER